MTPKSVVFACRLLGLRVSEVRVCANMHRDASTAAYASKCGRLEALQVSLRASCCIECMCRPLAGDSRNAILPLPAGPSVIVGCGKVTSRLNQHLALVPASMLSCHLLFVVAYPGLCFERDEPTLPRCPCSSCIAGPRGGPDSHVVPSLQRSSCAFTKVRIHAEQLRKVGYALSQACDFDSET